jgi:hypothetical protein
MKGTLVADGRSAAGGTALLMHNERLADPLDPHTRKLAAISGKRKKSEADHKSMAHIEFIGGLYTNGNGPCLPAWNILRCLQDGGKRHKRGEDVLRGVFPQVEHADVEYDGPRDPEQLWKDGGFSLRKGVGISRRKIMRTRPFFVEWQFRLPVEVDPVIFDQHVVETIWREAGVYSGIGDLRPIYGRFNGTVEWE